MSSTKLSVSSVAFYVQEVNMGYHRMKPQNPVNSVAVLCFPYPFVPVEDKTMSKWSL